MRPRDIAIVLSGGSINGVLMELGFLKRLRETPLWPRVGRIYGTSAGALAGTMAALDRLDDFEAFMYALRPQDTFYPRRLWQLPISGMHLYTLPATLDERLGAIDDLAHQLAVADRELVVCATDVSAHVEAGPQTGELVYSAWTTPPEEMAQAILASAAISALVLPMRVGDRIATDGAWVRNFPLAHAYEHDEVAMIVSFLYVPRYANLGIDLTALRRRLNRFRRVSPVKSLLAELDEAEERERRGEPGHHVEMIVRLMRLAVARNTALEETLATEKDASIRELAELRASVGEILAQHIRTPARRRRIQAAIDERFAQARFPFRHDRLVPRITVSASVGDISLEAGLRTQRPWSDEAKRALIDRGYELTDRELQKHGVEDDAAQAS